LVLKFHFRLIPQELQGISLYSRKKAGILEISFSTREGHSASPFSDFFKTWQPTATTLRVIRLRHHDFPCTEIQAVNDRINQDKTDKQNPSESDLESDNDSNESTRISSKPRRPPAAFKARLGPENPIAEKGNLLKHYKSDKEFSDDHDSLLSIVITKRFPGHCSLNGMITEHHPASDNYSITCQHGDSCVMSQSNILKYVKGTKQYQAHHKNQLVFYSTFHTAMS